MGGEGRHGARFARGQQGTGVVGQRNGHTATARAREFGTPCAMVQCEGDEFIEFGRADADAAQQRVVLGQQRAENSRVFQGGPGLDEEADEGEAEDTTWRHGAVGPEGMIWGLRRDGKVIAGVPVVGETGNGILVSELYDGVASPNVNHTLDIEADALQSGMYQIRLSSSQYLVVKKLLVTE